LVPDVEANVPAEVAVPKRSTRTALHLTSLTPTNTELLSTTETSILVGFTTGRSRARKHAMDPSATRLSFRTTPLALVTIDPGTTSCVTKHPPALNVLTSAA
jgi:hypothetical protein